MRREEFPEEIFGDYSWSMLMLAYIARLEQRTRLATDIMAQAGVSAAVGKRWLTFLREQDLVLPGETLQLTPTAVARMDRYIDCVIELASGQATI
ncbi:hypothetical protein SAMN04488241_1197 [Sphingomonas rubra]|uniref:Winged helix DNA-binding domain-containing protein n=2 Tax=Sphingomonas rubra TaxID=634430 RepID=A0A1I5UX42_9SPHN|nr:hypothetical protein SAMN04488241_1197 [Sphingomonas rubra]